MLSKCNFNSAVLVGIPGVGKTVLVMYASLIVMLSGISSVGKTVLVSVIATEPLWERYPV